MAKLLLGQSTTKAPRLSNSSTLSSATEGTPIPFGYGTDRLAGIVICASSLAEHAEVHSNKKGSQTTYGYSGSFGIAFCEGPATIVRIWADDKLIYDVTGTGKLYTFDAKDHAATYQYSLVPTIYKGTEDQQVDPTLQSIVGAGLCPAYRGLCYIVFTNFPLDDFGNRIPNFRAEVLSLSAFAGNPIVKTYPASTVHDPHGFYGASTFGALLDPIRHVAFTFDAYGWVVQRINLLTNTIEAQGLFDPTMYSDETATGSVGQFIGDDGSGPLGQGSPDLGVVDHDGFIWAVSGIQNSTFRDGYYLVQFDPYTFKAVRRVLLSPPLSPFNGPLSMNISPDGGYIFMTSEGYSGGMNLWCFRLSDLSVVGWTPLTFSGMSGGGPGSNFLYPIIAGNGMVYIVTSLFGAAYWWIIQINTLGGTSLFVPGELGPQYVDVKWWEFAHDTNTGTGMDALYNPTDNSLIVLTNFGAFHRFDIATTTIVETVGDYNHKQFGTTVPNGQNYGPTATPPVDWWIRGNGRGIVQNGEMFLPDVGYGLDTGSNYLRHNYVNVVRASDFQVDRSYNLSQWLPSSFYWPGAIYFSVAFDTGLNCAVVGAQAGSAAYQIFFDRADNNGVPVSGIVSDICQRAGLTPDQIETGRVTDDVLGYYVQRPLAASEAIKPLTEAYFFDVRESDFKLQSIPRGSSPVLTVAEKDLGLLADQGELTEQLGQEQDLPQQIILTFKNVATDYQPGKQQKTRHSRAVKTKQQETIDLPLVLTSDNARQIAEKTLYTRWVEKNSYQFKLWKGSYLPLDPGDVIDVVYEGITYQMRVAKTHIGQNLAIDLELFGDQTNAYQSQVGGAPSDGFVPPTIPFNGPTDLWLLDIPWLLDSDATSDTDTGFYYALAPSVQSGTWIGAALYESSDGTSFSSAGGASSPTKHGYASNVLAAPFSRWCWDFKNTLVVRVLNGNPSSSDMLSVLNGANMVVLGSEVISYVNATQNSDGSWTLDTLLRGQRGTEWACSGHTAGEVCLFVSASKLGEIETSIAQVGLAREFKAVTVGEAIDAVTARTFTYQANDLKPYAPDQIKGTRDGSQNLTITWVRRTRFDGEADWLDGVTDVPLHEASEAYSIDIMNGSTVVRTLSATSPTVAYSAANQTTDFGSTQSSVSCRIYQLSALVGRGFVATATV